jgi:hypothetical protein
LVISIDVEPTDVEGRLYFLEVIKMHNEKVVPTRLKVFFKFHFLSPAWWYTSINYSRDMGKGL